jgi:8-oxo-dGTP pyrophosphatase MutT (NUDIX family)
MTQTLLHSTSLPAALSAALSARASRAEAREGSKPAGVLVPLQQREGDWHVILNVRSQHVGQHRGEIAFPGGRLEPDDADMTACALRETWEEMGIRPEDVEVLGSLDAMLTRTNYLVWPTVGVVPHPYEFVINREVDSVIEVPLADLLNPANARHEGRLLPDGTVWNRQSYVSGEHLIFGATAWILGQLVALLRGLEPAPAGALDEPPDPPQTAEARSLATRARPERKESR